MRERTPIDDLVQGARNKALLEVILPAIRNAAKDAGYSVAVHGSLLRDIDLVAIPWRENAITNKDFLVQSICGAIRGVTGRCNPMKAWADKPHGRKAKTILV